MEKRYQVFVSSTYDDLREARQEVMQALLELDCIPAGMELFPAANDDQWTLIKRVIDACDYYIVISAGRYGSLGPQGIGYTEMEYRYAVERKLPVIGFLHKEPEKIERRFCETDPAITAKLHDFKAMVRTRMVKFWTSPAELGGVVSRSIINLIKTNPGVGWIRSNQVPDENLATENLKLRREIDELRKDLKASSNSAPTGAEMLAQGEDTVELKFRLRNTRFERPSKSNWLSAKTSWNALLASVLPHFLREASAKDLEKFVEWFVLTCDLAAVADFQEKWGGRDVYVEIPPDTLAMVLVQLRALGLIERSTKLRERKDTETYWALTAHGEALMVRLGAAKSPRAAAPPVI